MAAKEQSSSLAANGSEGSADPGEGVIYNSFDPLILQQNAGQEVLSFPTYNAALDEFYAKVMLTTTTACTCKKLELTTLLRGIPPEHMHHAVICSASMYNVSVSEGMRDVDLLKPDLHPLGMRTRLCVAGGAVEYKPWHTSGAVL